MAAFGAVLLRFLRRQDPVLLRRMIVSAAVYLGGALGIETIGFYVSAAWSEKAFTYRLLSTAEESCEMLGVALFPRAVLAHIATLPAIRRAITA